MGCRGASLHAIFDARVASAPHRVALREGDRAWTYAELAGRANQLARLLIGAGVGPEVPVGICMARSAATTIAVLAVLKAGGMFVPMDPTYPRERLGWMLEHSRVSLLIVDQASRAAVPRHEGRTLVIEEVWPQLRAERDDAPEVPFAPDAAAYVIYTSGSTGQPKGVVGLHRATVNRFAWMWESWPFAADEVSCQKTSIGFVDSIWEMLGPLLGGVPSVLIPQTIAADPRLLVEVLQQERVTRIVLVPSLLRELLTVLEARDLRLAHLRYCTSSGEALPTDLARRFLARLPDATLLNIYGSSEVAADVTCFPVRAGDPLSGTTVPIGSPITNTRVELLDAAQRPVQVGEIGELYVGGAALAREYLHRPDLSAERFVADLARPGERLFRTGDLARRLPDQTLEYLGRADHQVKIHGVRVELGEIEAVLRRAPGVSSAAVVARRDAVGEPRLVAYVAPAGRTTPSALRAHLMAYLPQPMIPAGFVLLDELPLTPSGKLARDALPPEPAPSDAEDSPPATPTEVRVAALWREVLGLPRVGRDTDFFAAGGTSILAARLVTGLFERLGVELPVRAIYERSTVRAMAARLDEAHDADVAAATLIAAIETDAHLDVDIQPVARQRPGATPAHVFLTGATGFLGAYLLAELLERPVDTVSCLVRAPSADIGARRLRANLERHGLWRHEYSDRIRCVPGDLESPRFGLDKAAFARLAEEVDEVWHNGASVHFLRPYAQVAAANVGGTREVIRLAFAQHTKPLHHVSTLAVLDTPSRLARTSVEEDLPEPHDLPFTGYAQSKLAAERLVRAAAQRGLPTAIYRCDDISGDRRHGRSNEDDFVWRWLVGCIQLGEAPLIDPVFRMLPVDSVAHALVTLADRGARGQTFHLRSTTAVSFSTLLRWAEGHGHALRRISYREWQDRMRALPARDPENALAPLASVFTEPCMAGGATLPEVYVADVRPDYDATNTITGLGSSELLEPIGEELFAVYLASFRRLGKLAPARSTGGQSVRHLFAREPSPGGDHDPLDASVAGRIDAFLHSSVTPAMDAPALAADFGETTIPEQPVDMETYFDALFERVVARAVRTHGQRFIGHMTSALPRFVHPLARVVTALNQNVVKIETSNATTFTERQTLGMLHRLVYERSASFYAAHTQGLESTLGMMVSGGTLGNIAGLWIARNRRLGPTADFAGVEAEGLAAALAHHGYRRAVVVGSSLMHYSMQKAVDVLGLGTRQLVHVPVDRDGRVDLDALERTVAGCEARGELVLALVGIAGTTETGAVDPLEAMAELAARRGVHFHVDAAWGGPTLFSRRHRALLAGIERADSVVIDGHKQLYTPMGCGVLLLRNPEAARAIEKVARYIVRAGSADLGRRTIEGSRPASSIFLHGVLHMLGRGGFEALVDGGLERCRFLADELDRRPAFERLGPPTLNILVYRYVPTSLRGRPLGDAENRRLNELNARIQEGQREEGEGFISRTTLSHTVHGAQVPIVALRAVLANPLTTNEDIRFVLDEQEQLGRRLEALGA